MKNENDYRYTGIMNIKVIDCCGSKCSSPGQSSGMGAHAEKQPGPTRVLDLLGILAAVVCLIHCLALPVVMTFLPTLIHHHTHDDFTHVILAGWVLLFCLTAIVPGFVKHGYRRILLLMVIGLSAVLAATFHSQVGLAESVEIPLITMGNLLIISAHLYNRRLLKAVS
ncbi:MAG: MerC domain-containing protein [Candidatus Obscuribacterales bacterium]|nr:MerC domain-containing protein [Cyanobacteria bacterium HKST-UBA01]MCB9469578.1 MerC domain-containing protein [Candidatus Obscuribacterales bacterium]